MLTKVPSRGSKTPVFCDRMGLFIFKGSPGCMGGCLLPGVNSSYLKVLSLVFGLFLSPLYSPSRYLLDVLSNEMMQAQDQGFLSRLMSLFGPMPFANQAFCNLKR